jgi:DNA invertase Pin-like site-specific DNA recombinase
VIQEYRDDGFSGDLLARPAMDRLRDDAGKGLFERVLILSPDRLARKWVYGEVIADEDAPQFNLCRRLALQQNHRRPTPDDP